VRLSPLDTSTAVWPVVPASDDDEEEECGTVGGMGDKAKICPLCPPQIPHDLTQARTWAVVEKPVGNRLSYGMALLINVAIVLHFI
jgi:hypothetical protein